MKKIASLLAAVSTFCIYLAWSVSAPGTNASKGGTVPISISERIGTFVAGDGVWLGASYALSAAFTVYAFMILRENRKRAVAGMTGGLVATGGLYMFGCYALGCCGSPMLPIWLGLFGAKGAHLGGPVVFAFTLASMAVGFFLLRRKSGCACGESCGGKEGKG